MTSLAIPVLASLAFGACARPGEDSSSAAAQGDAEGPAHLEGAVTEAAPHPQWSAGPGIQGADHLSPDTLALLRRLRDPEFYSSLSPTSYRWLGQELRSRIEAESASVARSGTLAYYSLRSSSEDWESSLKLTREEYERRRANYELGADLVKAGRDLTVGTLKAGAVVAGTTGVGIPEALALAAVSESTERTFNQVLSMYGKEADEAARNYLSLKFQSMPDGVWKEWEALADRSPEEARTLAARQIEKWTKLAGADSGSADAAVVKASLDGFLIKAAVAELASEKSFARLRDREVNTSLASLEGRMKAVGGALAAYSDETNRRLQRISDDQAEISAQLHEMKSGLGSVSSEIQATHGDVLDLRQDVGFLSNFLFSRMSAQEQKAALEAGFAAELPESEREDLVKKLELVAGRERFEADVAQALNGAQTLIDIGSKMGVDPKLLATAQRVVSTVSPAVGIMGALATGSWMEALEGVGALLGVGGPSEAGLAQARHEQVMDALGALGEGQQVLLDLSKASLEVQGEILEGQKRTIDGLVLLSGEVGEYHREVMASLDVIRQELRIDRNMIREIGLRDFRDCGTFLQARNLFTGFSENSCEFDDAGARRGHFAEYSVHFSRCVQGLSDLLQNPGYSKIFLLESIYEGAGDGVVQFDDQIFAPAVGLLTGIDSRKTPQWISLSLPAEKTQTVALRLESIREEVADRNLKIPFDVSRFEVPIAGDALKSLADDVLELVPYLELADFSEGVQMPSLESLLKGEGVRAAATRPAALLNSTLGLVNLAIAQEALIAGNGILPDVLAAVRSQRGSANPCGASDSPTRLNCILARNPVLARNLVLFGIGSELKTRGHSLYSYEFARNYRADDHLLRLVLGDAWKFDWRDGQWQVVLGGRPVPLPDPKALNADRMEYRSMMSDLVALRGRIAGGLAEIEMMRDADGGLSADLEGLLFSGL